MEQEASILEHKDDLGGVGTSPYYPFHGFVYGDVGDRPVGRHLHFSRRPSVLTRYERISMIQFDAPRSFEGHALPRLAAAGGFTCDEVCDNNAATCHDEDQSYGDNVDVETAFALHDILCAATDLSCPGVACGARGAPFVRSRLCTNAAPDGTGAACGVRAGPTDRRLCMCRPKTEKTAEEAAKEEEERARLHSVPKYTGPIRRVTDRDNLMLEGLEQACGLAEFGTNRWQAIGPDDRDDMVYVLEDSAHRSTVVRPPPHSRAIPLPGPGVQRVRDPTPSWVINAPPTTRASAPGDCGLLAGGAARSPHSGPVDLPCRRVGETVLLTMRRTISDRRVDVSKPTSPPAPSSTRTAPTTTAAKRRGAIRCRVCCLPPWDTTPCAPS